MKTEVRITQFKNALGQYLRSAQKGNEIVIKDRDTPIARLVPYGKERQRLVSYLPTGSLKDLDRLPRYRPKGLKPGDLDEALREERRERLDGLI